MRASTNDQLVLPEDALVEMVLDIEVALYAGILQVFDGDSYQYEEGYERKLERDVAGENTPLQSRKVHFIY